jgi:hypothetical protein
MRKTFFMKAVSSVLFATMLFLNLSQIAFALSISESSVSELFSPHDVEIDDSGNIHAVGLNMPTGPGSERLVYRYFNGSSWSGTDLDTDVGDLMRARIALDSTSDPHVAWLEYTGDPEAAEIYYKYHNGTAWQDIVTVDNTLLSDLDAWVGLDILSNDDAYIATCLDNALASVRGYKGGNGSSFTEISITTDADVVCSSVALVADGSDNIHLVTAPDNGGATETDVEYLYSDDAGDAGSWTLTKDISGATEIDPGAKKYIDITLDSGSPRVVGIGAPEGEDGYIYSLYKSGASWTLNSSVYTSSTNEGGPIVGLAIDPDTGYEWISYGIVNEGTGAFRYGYSDDNGVTWTQANIEGSVTMQDPDNYASMAYDSNAGTMVVLTRHQEVAESPPVTTRYVLSDLPGSSGAVPEFSTYMYLTTILVAFGLMQAHLGKTEEAMVA